MLWGTRRLQAFAVLEFLGKWSLWEVVALALLLTFGDLQLKSDAGGEVWHQHVWLGQGAARRSRSSSCWGDVRPQTAWR